MLRGIRGIAVNKQEAVETLLLLVLERAVRAAGPAITEGQRIALAAIDSLRQESRAMAEALQESPK